MNLTVFSTPASMAVTMFRGLRADGLRLKSFAVGASRSFLSRDGLWRRRHWFSLVFVVFSLLMVRAVLGLRTRREPVLIAGTVNELMNLSPKGFVNIGLAALQLAKERYPGLDVAATDRRIDEMAIKISRLARELQGKVERPETSAMNRVLFEEEGFKYDMDSLKHNRLDPGYLSYLLDTGQGDCFSMTTLCMVIAQRLGWHVYPVNAPGHVFLRYVTGDKGEYNIEPTSGGETLPDEFYTQNLAISAKSYEKGTYLRPLSDQEFLALLLNLSAAGMDPEKAIPRVKKALELDPTCASCWMQMAGLHHMMSVMTEGKESLGQDEEARQCAEKADELGWVALEDTPAWKRRMGQ